MLDTRIMHSRDGKSRWAYINNIRAPFIARGPSSGLPPSIDRPAFSLLLTLFVSLALSLSAPGPPVASGSALRPGHARNWRESAVHAVRGLVVRESFIRMFFWGARCRHGQVFCTVPPEGTPVESQARSAAQ